MMKFPKREVIDQLKKDYPQGTRVALLQMDDSQAPPIGTQGTVMGVDDMPIHLNAYSSANTINKKTVIATTKDNTPTRQLSI